MLATWGVHQTQAPLQNFDALSVRKRWHKGHLVRQVELFHTSLLMMYVRMCKDKHTYMHIYIHTCTRREGDEEKREKREREREEKRERGKEKERFDCW